MAPKIHTNDSDYFHLPAYILSRIGFVATHVVFAYWLNFLANDPFNTGLTATLDVPAADVKPAGECTAFDQQAALHNAALFLGWWASHSLPARNFVKKALGLWGSPIERPLYAFVAPIMWWQSMHFWKPVTDCSHFDVTTVNPIGAIVGGTIFVLGSVLVVALLWTLPQHVFGTDRYQYPPHKYPTFGKLISTGVYGVVRHPAAAGFLWLYTVIAFLGTTNHIQLSAMWATFIIIGTSVLEEGGLGEGGEFGKQYNAYRKKVNAYVPSWWSIKQTLGLKVDPITADADKTD